MKPQNHRRPQTIMLSDQQRAIVVDEICALIDNLLDLLIAIDPAPPFGIPFNGWELPAARRHSRRAPQARLIDDNLDLTRCMLVRSTSQSDGSKRNEPGVLYPLAYPLKAVWDKKIRTSRN
jgi:hypothetical protein